MTAVATEKNSRKPLGCLSDIAESLFQVAKKFSRLNPSLNLATLVRSQISLISLSVRGCKNTIVLYPFLNFAENLKSRVLINSNKIQMLHLFHRVSFIKLQQVSPRLGASVFFHDKATQIARLLQSPCCR